jgi:hypothetical protein
MLLLLEAEIENTDAQPHVDLHQNVRRGSAVSLVISGQK